MHFLRNERRRLTDGRPVEKRQKRDRGAEGDNGAAGVGWLIRRTGSVSDSVRGSLQSAAHMSNW